MSVSESIVGIDYHDERCQVGVMDAKGNELGNRSVRTDVLEVRGYLSGFGPVREIAIEACNGAARFADELSLVGGYRVRLAHPGFVQRMKRGLDKTDYGDAQVLSDLARVGYLPEVWHAPESIRDLRNLVRYRDVCARRRRDVKLRIRSLMSNNRVRCPGGLSLWTRKGLSWLECNREFPPHAQWILKSYVLELKHALLKLGEVEKRLEKVSRSDRFVQELMLEKGIGVITACIMRAEIGRFDRFQTGKQLSRFCGLSPRNVSSGKRQGDAGVISAGNPILKRALIQGALSLIRYDKQWQAFAERLGANGKPKPVIIVAVANRWIRKMFYRHVGASGTQQLMAA